MRKKWVIPTLLLALSTAGVIVAHKGSAETDWAIQGTWTDSCCCKVSCPCLFGTKPTEGYCQGASLIEVKSGHHGGVSLDGVSAIVTYHVGGWSKIVVDESAGAEKVAAMGALIPNVLPFLTKGAPPTVETASLAVKRDGDTISYSAAETSVALTMVRGKNGNPVRLHNLPAKGTPFPESDDHVQYKSEHLKHGDADQGFDWSGRNGFTATLNLSSAGSGS